MGFFQPTDRCLKKIDNSGRISAWKSGGLSDESIKTIAATNNNPSPALNYNNAKIRVKFDECYFKQDKFIIFIYSI